MTNTVSRGHYESSEESRCCTHHRHRSNLSVIAFKFIYFISFLALCLCGTASHGQMPQVAGAWRQSALKWTKPPAELHLKERTADAAVLYFGRDHQFVFLYAYVIQGPTWETISHGDGQVVCLGTWRQDGTVIHVEFQLTSRTIAKADETLPGPMKREDIQIVNSSIGFEKMHFLKDARLDNELRAINQGERTRESSPDHSLGAP